MTPGDEGTDGAFGVSGNLPLPNRKNISIRTSTAIPRTGRRIITAQQTKSGSRRVGGVTHFVAALGTSGTLLVSLGG